MNFITRVMVLEKRRMKKEAASPMSKPSPMSKGAPFSPDEEGGGEEDESPEEVQQEVKMGNREGGTNAELDGKPEDKSEIEGEDELDDEDTSLPEDTTDDDAAMKKAKKLSQTAQDSAARGNTATTDSGWRDKLTGKQTTAPKGTSAFASDKVNASKKSKLVNKVKEGWGSAEAIAQKNKRQANREKEIGQKSVPHKFGRSQKVSPTHPHTSALHKAGEKKKAEGGDSVNASKKTKKKINADVKSGSGDLPGRDSTGAVVGGKPQMTNEPETPEQAKARKERAANAHKVNRANYGGPEPINASKKTKKKVNAMKEQDKDWIQKAVNPDHEGYCTPMTKSTCTPQRKALAKTFKKMGRKRDKETKAQDEK